MTNALVIALILAQWSNTGSAGIANVPCRPLSGFRMSDPPVIFTERIDTTTHTIDYTVWLAPDGRTLQVWGPQSDQTPPVFPLNPNCRHRTVAASHVRMTKD